jgi:DNA anti-recombination protein RmuC
MNPSQNESRSASVDVATEEPTRAQVADASSGANLDKVRDILFGGPLRDVERRFTRLEERLAKDTSELRSEMRQRLETLESYVKSEVESLAGAIRAERDGRGEAVAAVIGELRETGRAFERRAAALDEQMAKGQRELRQQMLDQYHRLSEDTRQKIEDVLATIARESQELRADKTDRRVLAALLTEMAMRLTNEFRLPGAEDDHG